MSQKGQPSNNEGTGASKKNKFSKRQATNHPSTRPRSTPPHNPGQQKRRNSESPEQVAAKTRGSRQKKETNTHVHLKTNQLGIHATPLARKNLFFRC